MANALMEPASSTSRPNVLLVEDDTLLAEAYQAYLGEEDWMLAVAHTGRDALAAIERLGPEVILLDLLLPDMHGLKIVEFITTREIPVSVVVITSQGSIKTAVEAMRAGAWDFLVKPVSAERLVYTLRNALDRHRLHRTVQTYEETFARERYCGFIGASPQMQLVYRIIDSAAQSRATVFVTGESGTGKELCAEAIYRMSPRSNGPFVVVNCAAIPKDLMESEIFGHVKGAFTGATGDRKGAASLADGGTLFFDEICEMDTALQAKLLRFVQGGTFQRIGGSNEIKVDVRIICATNRDLQAEVESRRFREDLFYRLHVVPIDLPPLRQRGDDVPLIARRCLAKFAREEGRRFREFAPDAEAALRAHRWPGNVRQLQNVIRNIVVLNDGEVVTRAMLPPPLNGVEPSGAARSNAEAEVTEGGHSADAIRPLWMAERDLIEEAVLLCDGNVIRAAAQLGISDSTIYRKRRVWAHRGRA